MVNTGSISPEKEAFFAGLNDIAVTYDDVRLRTRSNRDAPLPDALDLTGHFSTNVTVKVPFISAAMSTVTEGDMAIAMAKEGGLGVIHSAMSIDKQRREVRRVKKDVNTIVEKPITFHDNKTLEQVLELCSEKKYDFRTFPILDSDGKFAGLLTGDDFKYAESMSMTVAETMRPARMVETARIGSISLQEAYRLMQSHKINTLPMLNDNNEVVAMYLWSDVSRTCREGARFNVDKAGQLFVAAAVSTGGDYMERVAEIHEYADAIVLDSADGDSYYAFKALENIKSNFDIDVVVGNISEGDSARELAEAGANGIKVGQGPGSICTTRPEMGIGMPQVTAVYNCAKALRDAGLNVPVCADGGIKEHGDTSIAIAAGANTVMMGRVFAGTEEAPGDIMQRPDGSKYKSYYGMGSAKALRENEASRQRYGGSTAKMPVPEGIESRVPYEGKLRDVLGTCVRALEKSMRYVKAPDIQTHRNQTLFRRITGAGLRESHPHDVEVVTQ